MIATRGNGLRFSKFFFMEGIVPKIKNLSPQLCLHNSYHKILSVKISKCWRVNLPAPHWLNYLEEASKNIHPIRGNQVQFTKLR